MLVQSGRAWGHILGGGGGHSVLLYKNGKTTSWLAIELHGLWHKNRKNCHKHFN